MDTPPTIPLYDPSVAELKRKNTLLLAMVVLLFCLLIIVSGIGGYIFLKSRSRNNITAMTQVTPALTSINDPNPINLPSHTPNTATDLRSNCTARDLGITLSLPKEWSCEVGVEHMNMNNNGLEITIATGGRGYPCIDDPTVAQYSPACKIRVYLSSDNYTIRAYSDLDTVSYFGDLSSTFTLTSPYGEKYVPWIEVSNSSEHLKELTSAEKKAVIEVLNTLSKIPK